MVRKSSLMIFVVVLSLAVAVSVAFADQPASVGGGLGNKSPNFNPGLYADGVAWGTKGTTTLPAPRENNEQSFDKLFVIVDGVEGQLPVGEAAPGNLMFNGGRWVTYTATWTVPAHALLMSYDDVMYHAGLGHLEIVAGSPEGGPPDYFQCPLLPVK
jgi:hypothetical protein